MNKPEPILLQSDVSKATVYTDRAILTRTTSAKLSTGPQTLKITNLPLDLDENSLRVSAFGLEGLSILDIRTKKEYHSEAPHEKIRSLQERMEKVNEAINQLEDEEEIIEKKKELIDGIKDFTVESISGDFERKRPEIKDWQQVMGFMGESLTSLNQEVYGLKKKAKELDKEKAEIEAALKEIIGAAKKWWMGATLELEVETAGEAHFEISYQVNQAWWTPFYEARVDSESKDVELRYYGKVVQQTGEDWTGIELKLSTARPHIGGNPPELYPWYMDIFVPRPQAKPGSMGGSGANRMIKRKAKKAMMMSKMEVTASMDMEEMEELMEEPAVEMAKERETVVEVGSGASVVFRINGDSDVPGDGSSSRHLVMGGRFASKFKYLTIPKLNELAYLTAEVKNESEHPFLAGPLSIFMDGNFIGKASIKELVTPEEKFDLNLGVDESIKVKRKLLRKKGDEKGIFSKSKRTDYEFQITIENLRNSAEEIVVRDQVPVSQDEKIKVEVKKVEPAENPAKDKDKLAQGAIEWKLSLPSKESQKCFLSFSVEHPTDIRISEF